MAQRDKWTRLSAVDTSFLIQEKSASHMHIGGAIIFEGPAPTTAELRKHVNSRLHLIPRYRQKLAVPRFEAGRPFWIDDSHFNLEYHVRDSALPAPGDDYQLEHLIARIFSQRLDRAKPLWELWFISGLADNRFAIISKAHHSLIDGISGVDIGTVLFDIEREPSYAVGPTEEWIPSPTPSQADLIAEGIKEVIHAPINIVESAAKALEHPRHTYKNLRESLDAVGAVARQVLEVAPATPLNVPIGPHRRYMWSRGRLSEFKEIKDTLGGTINDVVLTVVADAIGRWLRSRKVSTIGLDLRALVPVSTRTEDERGQLGNRVSAMRCPLPVDRMESTKRLELVKAAMGGLKESKQALGAEAIANVQNFAPPTILAQASRLTFSTRLFNLIVTNVPGPQVPLYVMGRRAVDVFPIAFLPERHALAIAIMSYDGKLNFGLLADYDAMPDLDIIADGIAEATNDLLKIARAKDQPSKPTTKKARAKKSV